MLLEKVRNIVIDAPEFLTKPLGSIPINLKLFPSYGRSLDEIQKFRDLAPDKQNKFVLHKISNIVSHAYKNITFYQDFYGSEPKIQSFEDFYKLPLLNRHHIDGLFNSIDKNKGFCTNTGGTTGTPAQFALDRDCWGREWAHLLIHWQKYGYGRNGQLITMMGKNLGKNILFKYNPIHNEYNIDPYKFDQIDNPQLLKFFRSVKKKILLQGYPTNIYRILKKLIETNEGLYFVKNNIEAVFLSSEKPSEIINEFILDVMPSTRVCIWYGLSEQCVFAEGNIDKNIYFPHHTYGFTEVVKNEIIGTSFNNKLMPLIRYSTGDEAKVIKKNNELISELIIQGRKSEYVIDSDNNNISLVSFTGRHHRIYNLVNFIQLYQDKPGTLHYFVVPKQECKSHKFSIKKDFMFDNDLKMVIKIHIIEEPIFTDSGKTPPKITLLPEKYKKFIS
jgi:phenylacetate-CoA ligase